MGAQSGIADHMTVGDDCLIMPQAGVAGNLPPKSYVGGTPAESREVFVNNLMQVKRIKTIGRRLKELIVRVDKMEASHAADPSETTRAESQST
jgi:UDP-3-O-[3-hydroxymyristoyl] glucosamine N-acyltransferase